VDHLGEKSLSLFRKKIEHNHQLMADEEIKNRAFCFQVIDRKNSENCMSMAKIRMVMK